MSKRDVQVIYIMMIRESENKEESVRLCFFRHPHITITIINIIIITIIIIIIISQRTWRRM